MELEMPTRPRNGTVPARLKYQRVEAEIRQLVQGLPIGAKLPSEREMAAAYSCNFLTVRKALKQVVGDGTVVRRVGSGTYVARHAEEPVAGGTKMGILVSQQSNAYAYRLLQSVAHAGLEQNVNLTSIWVDSLDDKALKQARQLQREGCVALTLPWFPHDRTDEVQEFVERCPLPVSLAMLIPGLEKNCFLKPEIFGVDNGIEDLAAYYRMLGHERIAFIGPDSPNDVILQKKLTSYVRYTSRENLPSFCGLVEPGAQAMDTLAQRWQGHRGNFAIISYDDEHALRFMTAMHKLGLSAPADFCIIGFNDTEASRYSDPPLTTVHQYYDAIGEWLLKNALALSQGKVCQSSTIPRLQVLVRSTCGGRGKIDEKFRLRFLRLDIVVEDSAHVHETVNTM
jgi:DNA-binding LacI/PurR family transcriptional regulator